MFGKSNISQYALQYVECFLVPCSYAPLIIHLYFSLYIFLIRSWHYYSLSIRFYNVYKMYVCHWTPVVLWLHIFLTICSLLCRLTSAVTSEFLHGLWEQHNLILIKTVWHIYHKALYQFRITLIRCYTPCDSRGRRSWINSVSTLKHMKLLG